MPPYCRRQKGTHNAAIISAMNADNEYRERREMFDSLVRALRDRVNQYNDAAAGKRRGENNPHSHHMDINNGFEPHYFWVKIQAEPMKTSFRGELPNDSGNFKCMLETSAEPQPSVPITLDVFNMEFDTGKAKYSVETLSETLIQWILTGNSP